MLCLIGLVLATLPAFHVVAAQERNLLQEFALQEYFGVSHADPDPGRALP